MVLRRKQGIKMKRILSGVRPTGDIHLGNYLGAIRQWVELQHQADSTLFCIVDLHALTTLEESTDLAAKTRLVAAAYLACGIDPSKSFIFAQSHVASHAELAWIFSCLTPLGWLNRMTQFKDKAGKHKEQAPLGLYAYPVLMAADILVYKATHIPVGEDQKQHVELARDIAGAFNHRYGEPYFTLPEPLILGEGARVMSLRDGSMKMSKSDPSEYSRLHLMDDADTIRLKIRKARTDPDPLPESAAGLENRPEARNLITIYAALANQTADTVCQQFAGQLFSSFKEKLTDLLVASLAPMGTEIRKLLQDPGALDAHLRRGAEKACEMATSHMREIYDIVGLLPFNGEKPS